MSQQATNYNDVKQLGDKIKDISSSKNERWKHASNAHFSMNTTTAQTASGEA